MIARWEWTYSFILFLQTLFLYFYSFLLLFKPLCLVFMYLPFKIVLFLCFPVIQFTLVSSPKRHHPPWLEARQSLSRFVFQRQKYCKSEVVWFRNKSFVDKYDENDWSNRNTRVYGSWSVWRRRIRQKERCVFVWNDCLGYLHRKESVWNNLKSSTT